jgi:hypothetical protein
MADITLLATADWDQLLWTNKQHVASEFADLGHRVLYIESLGLRAPRRQAKDLGRILRRLLWVWSPLVLPGARGELITRLNRSILLGGLALARRWLGLRAELLWTYNPKTLAYGLPGPYEILVYHCVDDIQAQPDMDDPDLSAWEERLCRAAELVFVTSPALQESRRRFNSNTHYFSNVLALSLRSLAISPPFLDLASVLWEPSVLTSLTLTSLPS